MSGVKYNILQPNSEALEEGDQVASEHVLATDRPEYINKTLVQS